MLMPLFTKLNPNRVVSMPPWGRAGEPYGDSAIECIRLLANCQLAA
jgi:hypothetical protein